MVGDATPTAPVPGAALLLASEREKARAQVADLAAEVAGIVEAAAAAPPDDEHDAEGSTVGFERARLSALLAHAETRLAELDLAIGRLPTDSYGRCEVCLQPIPPERLAALPSARTCVACATAAPPLYRRGPSR
jgi:DnaK suppressor protein